MKKQVFLCFCAVLLLSACIIDRWHEEWMFIQNSTDQKVDVQLFSDSFYSFDAGQEFYYESVLHFDRLTPLDFWRDSVVFRYEDGTSVTHTYHKSDSSITFTPAENNIFDSASWINMGNFKWYYFIKDSN